MKGAINLPKEEHYSTGVVQLVHLVEVRDLADIDEVDDAKVLHLRNKVARRLK